MKSLNLFSGFTLIEFIISIGLSMILFLVVMTTLTNALEGRGRASAVTDMQKTAAIIVNDITPNVRWAKSVALGVGLEATQQNDDVIRYRINSGTMVKDPGSGTYSAMHSDNISISDFTVKLEPDATSPNRVYISIEVKSVDFPKLPPYTKDSTMSIRINNLGTP